jgi:hypothetical protein
MYLPLNPNHLAYVYARNANQQPMYLQEVPLAHHPGESPIIHGFPQMIIGVTQDLPRGTILNLFHPTSQSPIAVLPAPDDVSLTKFIPLPIFPQNIRVQQQQQQQQQNMPPNPNPQGPTQ